MYPYLFGLEWLPMYGFLMAVGMLAAILLFKFVCAKKKVDDSTYNFYSLLAVISIAVGLLGAFFFQAVYNFIDSGFKKFEFKGLTFMGGLITGVVVFVLGTLFFAKGQVKRNFWQTANYAAPSIVLGHAIGRLGCFFAGCCYGKPTNSFLGVIFPDLRDYPFSYPEYVATGGKAYPTQLFEVFFLIALFAVMLLLLFKFKKPNVLLLLYGYAYSVFRFLIEFIRGDARGQFLPFLSPSQWQSIALLLFTVALTLVIYKFKRIPFALAPLINEPTAPASAPDEENKDNPS